MGGKFKLPMQKEGIFTNIFNFDQSWKKAEILSDFDDFDSGVLQN